MKKPSTQNTGWATLELVMSIPAIILLLAVIYYAGNIGFTKLHLTSAVDAGARIAAVQGCREGVTYVRASFPDPSKFSELDCKDGDKDISFTVSYEVVFPLTSMPSLNKKVRVSAFALNELYYKNLN